MLKQAGTKAEAACSFVEPADPPEAATHELPCTSYNLLFDLKWPNYPVGFAGEPDVSAQPLSQACSCSCSPAWLLTTKQRCRGCQLQVFCCFA